MQILNVNANIYYVYRLYFSWENSLKTFHGSKESKTYSSLIKYLFSGGFFWVIA